MRAVPVQTARFLIFVLCIAAAMIARIDGLRAQPATKPVIAVLASGTAPANSRYFGAFRQALAELGHLEGRDYVVDLRAAEGEIARLPALARELMNGKPRLFLASSAHAVLALREVTSDVPIVSPFLGSIAPFGFIASQARPGHNVTGIIGSVEAGLVGKQVALARDIKPQATKLGVLRNPTVQKEILEVQLASVESAAASLSFDVVTADARTVADLPEAFSNLAAAGADVVWVLADPLYIIFRDAIADAAEAVRLPTIFAFREHVEAGGLASYGIDLVANFRRSAALVDKILRGTKPADLPVERPTTFELVINLKTARKLGLTLPETFLVRADHVIE